MRESSDFETVAVAAALVVHGNRILVIYNSKWGGYTLPMTKRRSWQDPKTPQQLLLEDWEHAAVRARAEFLPGTRNMSARLVLEIPEYQQSDRDGHWKRFHFKVFRIAAEPDDVLAFVNHEWLTVKEILDERRLPISKTARDLVAQAQRDTESEGLKFP